MKRLLAALLVVAAVVAGILALTGRESFHAETTVKASPQAVWEVLTAPETYKDWNPVFVEVAGTFAAGQTVTTTVLFPHGARVALEGEVVSIIEHREIRQRGGIRGFVTFEHVWQLEAVEGGTRIVQREVDRGLFLWFWDSSWVEPAYQRATEALAAYLENKG